MAGILLLSCSPRFYDGEGNKIPTKAVQKYVMRHFVMLDSTDEALVRKHFYLIDSTER